MIKEEAKSEKKTDEDSDDNESEKEKKEALNSPEIVERFYTEIVEQIDIEYNGLWTKICKSSTNNSNGLIENFINKIPLEQYLKDNNTKERCMQMMMRSYM